MVGGRSRGSPGMVLTVVLLMVMAAQTKGKSQLSIVEDINKSLENILLDVQSLYEYTDLSTTSRETTPEGESTLGFTTETSSKFSVSTTGTTHVDSSSTDISSAPTDTTSTTIPTLTTSMTTASSTSTTSTTATIPTPTTSRTTASPTTTTSMTTASPTTTTSTKTTISTSTTSTPTESPTTTTSTTTTTLPTTSTTTSAPTNPKPNGRVKRRNLLSLATLDDVLSAWVDPRSTWLEDKMSTETSDGTSDVTSDITSLESTIPTSTAVTTPVSDITRLEGALYEADEVVTQVAAGTITEDQVTQMQAAEAGVKNVTGEPDEALQKKLQQDSDYLDGLIELIKKDQVTITETLDKLKKRNTGIIVGSVLGGLVLVVLVVAGTVYYVRRKKKMNAAGGRATSKKRSQSAGASSQQQMVELRTDHGMEDPYPPDEFRPHSRTPPNPLIPRANFDNSSLSSAQRNNPPESSRIPGRESPMQVSEMRTEPSIENPGYVEEQPPRPVVPPKPRNRPSTFDDFGVSPSQIRIGQEPSKADFVPSEQTHYIDELNYRLAPRERQARPIEGGNYHSPTEPSQRSRRDRSPRHPQHHHHHHPRNHYHRMRHRNDHHVKRTPSMPPPDYTMPRGKHQSPDDFISRKPHSQEQRSPRSPYEFEAPQRPSAPPESAPPRPERNRSDIRRPYGPEDLY